jgi:Exoribonuclease Xrn1 D2/D3 domain
MLHGADIFHQENSDAKIKEAKAWLTARGVRDFEPVSLTAEQLNKVRCTVHGDLILALFDTRHSGNN